MAETGAILLAAGLSRRMGNETNKLLLPINGRPMIAHMAALYTGVTDSEVLVVTGHEHQAVSAALAGMPVRIVFNPDYESGQVSSVVCGLRSAESAGGLLIGLGDQPRLRSRDLTDLIAAHHRSDPGKISIPRNNEARGNPILVPESLRPRLLSDPRSPGCRKFTRAHPELVQFHALPAPGFYMDVDAPSDYAALAQSQPEGAS